MQFLLILFASTVNKMDKSDLKWCRQYLRNIFWPTNVTQHQNPGFLKHA